MIPSDHMLTSTVTSLVKRFQMYAKKSWTMYKIAKRLVPWEKWVRKSNYSNVFFNCFSKTRKDNLTDAIIFWSNDSKESYDEGAEMMRLPILTMGIVVETHTHTPFLLARIFTILLLHRQKNTNYSFGARSATSA